MCSLVEPGLRAALVAHQLLRLKPQGDLFISGGHRVAAVDQVPEAHTHTSASFSGWGTYFKVIPYNIVLLPKKSTYLRYLVNACSHLV